MIKSLKVSAVALTLALTSSYSLAADKVVVIPLGGKDATPGIAAFSGENRSWLLTSSYTVFKSVTIDTPDSGTVIVNASGYVFVGSQGSGHTYWVECGITTSVDWVDKDSHYWGMQDTNAYHWDTDQFGSLKGYNVAAGSHTYNLVCRVTSDSSIVLQNVHMSAMFFPSM